jgi:membrane protein
VNLRGRIWEKAKFLYYRYDASDIATRSAALAFHTILALVPIVGIIFWYLSKIRLTDKWLMEVQSWILGQLNVSSSAEFVRYFTRLTKAAGGYTWGWIGFILLLYSTYNLIDKFGSSIDRILGTRERPEDAKDKTHATFSFLALVGRRLIVMLALPIALVISLSLSQWIRSDSWFHYIFEMERVGPYFAMPLAWVTTIVSMFLVYYFVPRKSVPWREALKAALVVGPVTELVRYVIGLYNTHAVATLKIYGVLAVIPLFVAWVQISWTVLLCGALLMKVPYAADRKRR